MKRFLMQASLVVVTLLVGLSGSEAAEPLDRTGTLWTPLLQWTLRSSTVQGNPFDLEATVTFTHRQSGEKRRTGMFYDGDNQWKFRFTGTAVGFWDFETSSDNAQLDGKRGTVTIDNPDPAARGFIRAAGNKYARQRGEAGELEAFVPNIYMNLVRFGVPEICGWTAVSPTFSDRDVFAAYLDEAAQHGCNGVFARVGNQWFQAQAVSWQDHQSENPDPQTFRAFEQAIMQAHERGMFLHLWAWGDEQRKWTPVGVGDGINGKADRRLQRYMAARLGPLPGWTMSYGSDLNEWVRPEQVVSWAEFLREQSGWEPMLSARSVGRRGERFPPVDSLTIASFDDTPEQDFYQTARRRLEEKPTRPVLLERRFSYLRDEVWDMETTRRALWQFALAGGAAAIWGHYPAEGRCSARFQGEYPSPEQMRTHLEFWRGRFAVEMVAEPDLSKDVNALVLCSGKQQAVVYREDAESIHVNLTGFDSPAAVAVDTKKEYDEIDLGMLEAKPQTWQAPYASDWAIAVGRFPHRDNQRQQ